MVTKFKIWQPFIIALVMVVGIVVGSSLHQDETRITVIERPSEHFSKLDRVGQILRYIDAKYVDSIDLEKLSMDAIKSILDNLDPHSFFIPPSNVDQVNQQLQGSMYGVGIEYAMYQDTLSILRVIPGGPAHKAGLLAGDRIIRVDSTVVSGVKMELEELRSYFYGDPGSPIMVQVDRYDEPLIWMQVRRGQVTFPAIENVIELDSATLYMSIRTFSSTVYKEFVDSLYAYGADKETKNLILDLRDNSGGYLDEAIKILSQLIVERDLPLVKTVGYRSSDYTYITGGNRYFKFDNIAILINEYSASASEILAGALQDYDLATVIGRRSFGKGLVQNQYSLSDGSAIRLTIARYYTPSGRLIQKPYKADSAHVEYNRDILARYQSGELLHKDSIPIIDSMRYYTRNGRLIYGSEGIVPDIFIPIDSLDRFSLNSSRRATVLACSFNYARENHLFKSKEILNFDTIDLDSIVDSCLGKGKSNDKEKLKQAFEQNLIFAQAGSKAAKRYSLERDEFVKAAMRFDENQQLLKKAEESVEKVGME